MNRPWVSPSDPPRSFTCGDLGRFIYRERLGLDSPLIWADASILRQCLNNLRDFSRYGLSPASGPPRPYDVAMLARNRDFDHMGIGVASCEGLMILHCQQGAGVRLNSWAELSGEGFRHLYWMRHKDVTEEMALCRA